MKTKFMKLTSELLDERELSKREAIQLLEDPTTVVYTADINEVRIVTLRYKGSDYYASTAKKLASFLYDKIKDDLMLRYILKTDQSNTPVILPIVHKLGNDIISFSEIRNICTMAYDIIIFKAIINDRYHAIFKNINPNDAKISFKLSNYSPKFKFFEFTFSFKNS